MADLYAKSAKVPVIVAWLIPTYIVEPDKAIRNVSSFHW